MNGICSFILWNALVVYKTKRIQKNAWAKPFIRESEVQIIISFLYRVIEKYFENQKNANKEQNVSLHLPSGQDACSSGDDTYGNEDEYGGDDNYI